MQRLRCPWFLTVSNIEYNKYCISTLYRQTLLPPPLYATQTYSRLCSTNHTENSNYHSPRNGQRKRFSRTVSSTGDYNICTSKRTKREAQVNYSWYYLNYRDWVTRWIGTSLTWLGSSRPQEGSPHVFEFFG
jgi:hypothetical protein